ncbi:MAG: C39 family peptidase [Candidatus Latescibacterota bacterium]|nr:C39 family peptidase [Candidatus Latescibacterota bacterium]
MSTSLLFFAQNADEALLKCAVPPSLWPGQVVPLIWDGATFAAALPQELLHEALEILPCFSLADCGAWAYQFTLQYTTQAGHQGHTALDPIGAFVQAESDNKEGAVEAAIDILQIREPLQMANLHLSVQGINPQAPALLAISIRNKDAVPDALSGGQGIAIDVPPRSQMVLRPELASHVCSPTSVAMLLDHYDRSADIYDLIAEVRHQPSGLHGVWPANIRAAAQRGLLGYLLHFPSWDTARALLDEGFPIVASVRYKEGELSHAAIPRTKGHLLVVRGYEGDQILVNDPAAATDAEVVRAYDLREFCRIWLERNAVGYVIFALDD